MVPKKRMPPPGVRDRKAARINFPTESERSISRRFAVRQAEVSVWDMN